MCYESPFIVSTVVIYILPGNKGAGLKEIIWKSFSLILDQGNLQPDPSPVVTLILSIIAVLGMIFLSGGMVAFLSSMFQDYLEEIRDGDPELAELWKDEPIVAQTESELKTRLIEEINKGSATLFVFSDRSDTFDYGERYNFELWISLITEVERQQIRKNRIFYEMDDKTDAQIIEGFEIGECVIRDMIINEYYLENLLQ